MILSSDRTGRSTLFCPSIPAAQSQAETPLRTPNIPRSLVGTRLEQPSTPSSPWQYMCIGTMIFHGTPKAVIGSTSRCVGDFGVTLVVRSAWPRQGPARHREPSPRESPTDGPPEGLLVHRGAGSDLALHCGRRIGHTRVHCCTCCCTELTSSAGAAAPVAAAPALDLLAFPPSPGISVPSPDSFVPNPFRPRSQPQLRPQPWHRRSVL